LIEGVSSSLVAVLFKSHGRLIKAPTSSDDVLVQPLMVAAAGRLLIDGP
jgi:hypothetical protein